MYGRTSDWSSLLCVLLLLLLVTTTAASSAAATRAGLRLQLLPSCCADGFQIVVGHDCVMWCAGRGSETITCYSGTRVKSQTQMSAGTSAATDCPAIRKAMITCGRWHEGDEQDQA